MRRFISERARKKPFQITDRGGAVASWLLYSITDRAVLVRSLAEDIVLYSWVSASLHPGVKMGNDKLSAEGNPEIHYHPI